MLPRHWMAGVLTTLTLSGAAAANDYGQVIAATAGMVGDGSARELAGRYGLEVLNVTWEDTGRFKGSAVGPNISDMTIQVQHEDPQGRIRLTCMPVIRFPNFSDKTGDVPIDAFKLLVGNERGQELREVTLRELLGNLRRYLSDPLSWDGQGRSLLAERDTHVLASAQACFLPVPLQGQAEFNPVLFNYQSTPGDPAVLTILVTRQGTSVTVIDNVRDGFQEAGVWGQRLFFNQAGQRASLTGQRLSDFRAAQPATEPRTPAERAQRPDDAGGLNQVLLIQVPLKQKNPPQRGIMAPSAACEDADGCAEMERRSDVEEAVIGHGEVEGPFTELDNLAVERDPRFPIRVTVQFYKATSNGAVNAADMETIAGQIASVYAKAEAVGSLVTQGETGRVTEHQGPKVEVPGWWGEFWSRHERSTGRSREESLRLLRELFGPGYVPPSPEAATRAVEKASVLSGVTRAPEPPRDGDAQPGAQWVCGTDTPASGGCAISVPGRLSGAWLALACVALGLAVARRIA